MDTLIAPVLLLSGSLLLNVSLSEHKTLLSLGSLVEIFGLLLGAPVGTLDATITPVLLLSKSELWNWWLGSIDLPGGLGWSLIERLVIKSLSINSGFNLLIAPFVRVDLSVAPVLLIFLHEHKALLSLGSLIKVFSLLLSAPVGSLNSAIAPVLLLGKGELWDWWFSSIDLPSSLGWSLIKRFIIKSFGVKSSLNFLIAPFVRVDLSVAPVLLLLLHEHKALLSLGSLIEILGLLLSAPVGSLDSAIAPVLLLGSRNLLNNLVTCLIVNLAIWSVNESIKLVNLSSVSLNLLISLISIIEPVLRVHLKEGNSLLDGGDWLSSES